MPYAHTNTDQKAYMPMYLYIHIYIYYLICYILYYIIYILSTCTYIQMYTYMHNLSESRLPGLLLPIGSGMLIQGHVVDEIPGPFG